MARVLLAGRLLLTLYASFEPTAGPGSLGPWVLGRWVLESLGPVGPWVLASLCDSIH